MAVNQEQVKQLLGAGLSAETVASAVGCDPSYISQLMEDESFATTVATQRVVALAGHSQRDATIDGIEDKLLNKLDKAISEDAIYKPADLLRAFSVVNNAKRRGQPLSGHHTTIQTVVQLNLPERVVRKFKTDSTNKVIEIDGENMTTMPSVQLLSSLHKNAVDKGAAGHRTGAVAQQNERAVNRYAEAAKYIPGGSGLSVRTVGKREGFKHLQNISEEDL